ncbi:cytochrome P450 [Aspergillus luchuensis]|uniref:Cytochrome P450 n=1 Tax=Aspergillus kawachii TaxID=1069201 RepID=A0A146G1T3_ASPKA|nr:cytochrome P450 [Aspergillus luchuensis]
MMRDPARYSHAQQFDGFRFARANKLLALNEGCADVPEGAPLQLTDVDVDWPIWGLGNTAWDGSADWRTLGLFGGVRGGPVLSPALGRWWCFNAGRWSRPPWSGGRD